MGLNVNIVSRVMRVEGFKMADTGQQELELLFFDTFSHENTEELNLDLVQFPRPVIIHEVRVIPLKTRVQADVPGGVRLGATNPSSFSLELFVNNLNKPNASTFEKLGMLNYKENVDIQMKADGEIPTDGLILKGWYNTLTVAIYGTLTVVKPEHPSPPPPPPPQRAKQAVEAVRSTNPAEQTRPEWEPPRQPAKPQQQHPLDYINQQVQLQQQQQQAAQAAHTLIPPPHTIGHPSPQSGVPPPQGPTQGVPPAKQSEAFPDQYDRPHHAGQSQHRDILQDFISSPKMGHMEQRDGHFDPRVDPRQSPNVGRDGQFPSESREQFEFEDFRGHRESGGRDSDFERSRENSRDRDFREKEREVRKKEWERFRERERERSREKEREYGDRDWPRSPARRKSYSRSPSNSRSRSRSRSRSYSRSHSRSPRRSARSSRSPRRSFSRSPRRSRSRSRSSIRSRSRTPIRSRSRSPMRSYSRSPERRSPAPVPGSPLQTPLSPSRSRSHSRDMESPIHQIPTITRRQPDSSPPYMREPSPTPEEIMEAGEIIDEIGEDALFDPLSPDGMNYSDDGEVQDIGDTYENISSDDELPVMEEIDHFQDYEDIDESWTFPTPTFNPFNTEFVPLLTFTDNSYTSYELEKMLIQQDTGKTMETPVEAKSLLGIVEEFTASDHHDKWISALEEAPKLLPKGLSYLLLRENRMDVLDTLIDWVVEGLDEKKAILQPENAFKIRHLKMGIKLAGSMGCCDSDVTVRLLEKNIQHKLLDLYCSPCMSFSLKLQIVQALDHTTRIRDGFEWLMGVHPMQKVIKSEVKTEHMPEIKQEVMEDPTGYTESCYTKLLEIMLKKQNVRVTVALTALLKKIHTFQILAKLSYQVDSIIESTPSLDEKTGESGTKVQEDADAMETDMEGMLGNHVVNEMEMESIISNLAEITKVFTIADQIIGQPKRTLPGKCMFDSKGAQYNPYPVLYHISHTHHLLEGVFYLLSSPATSSHPLLFAAVRDFLQTLIKTQSGLLFLFSKPETSNGIIRCLIQLADDGRDEAVDENPMQQLGLDLVYHLQTLQHVDQLLARQKENKELDNPQVISILHSLYTMTFTPQGRQAVINVLCMENNLEVLLSIVDKTGDEEQDTKRKKSVCVAYSMGLLLILLRHSTNVQIFEKFGPRLVTLSDEDFSSKLLEMQEWLSPVRSMTCYTYNSVSTAVQQLKQHADDLQKIPRGLITTMRILRHMTIPPERKYPEETSDALKYRYAVLEMYSADSLSVLMNILQKVSEILLRPWQRGIPQSSEQISYHLAVVKPTLEIVKYTLGYIIMARGTEFRDLTALPVLFELNTVLCSVPLSSSHLLELQEIQRNIMDALMTYTQPIPSQSDSDESLSQSLWTKTMKELLKYTTKAPYTYLSGLLLLSELLPLPLPIQTKEPLSDAEVQLAVNCRKLWSVHLHSLTSDIQEMIQILATSTCQPLQQVLRRVCWQLSDLSAPMAVVITKCILDLVVNSFQTLRKTAERKEEGENIDETIGRIASPYASKMLNLLAFVLSQPSIKCAALQLMTNAGDPAIEKYGEMLPHMLEILNSVCQSVPHVQAQECIVSILQSICDPEVALVIGDTVPINDQIAYSLPNSDYMTRITTALLDHMGSPDHSYASILPCVRTLVMLTEHDYGFYHLKTVLEQKTTAIGRLMVRINTTFSKDSSDCLSTLSTLLEFLRLLMTVEGATEDGITVTRTCSLSQQDLQKVLSWNPSMENHPLLDLEKLLEDCAKDEETLESLLESMTSLMKMLREKDKESQEKPVLGKPELPLTENLSNLYNLRTVFVVTDMEDERLNPDYWLSNPATDVADIEPELIMFNMEDMCHKYCPEFNLEEELKKTVATSQAELTKPRRIRTGDRRKSQEISINRGRGLKRPFVAPMRGRGIARGMMGAGGRMDSFRTRTPNTSRPPSMHVDDFMKLEKGQNDQENRNAGVPVSPIRRVDSVIQRDNRGRGRGFDRGRGGFNRGRFFTPPGNYGPRESNNIYVGGGGVGGSGGGRGNYNNRPKPNYESPHSFARGNYAGSGDRRGGRDYRYSPRGRGNFFNKDKDPSGRFMGGGFRGRRDTQDRGRHVRSFTK